MSVNMNLISTPIHATADDQDPNFKHTGPENNREFKFAHEDANNHLERRFYDHTPIAWDMIALSADPEALAAYLPDDDTKVFANLHRTSEALRDTTLYETNREQYVRNVLSPLEEAMDRSDGKLLGYLSYLRTHMQSLLPNQPHHMARDEDFQQLIKDSTTELNNATKGNDLGEATDEERFRIGDRLRSLAERIPDDTSRVFLALKSASEHMSNTFFTLEGREELYWNGLLPQIKRARMYTDGPLRDYLDKLWDAVPYQATQSENNQRHTGPLDDKDKDYPDALEQSTTNIGARLRDKKLTSKEYVGFAYDLRVLASYIPDDDSRVHRAMLRAADAFAERDLLASDESDLLTSDKPSYSREVARHLGYAKDNTRGPLQEYLDKLFEATLPLKKLFSDRDSEGQPEWLS